RLTAARVSASALMPNRTRAGSPGIRSTTKNVITETPIRTNRVKARRTIVKRSILPRKAARGGNRPGQVSTKGALFDVHVGEQEIPPHIERESLYVASRSARELSMLDNYAWQVSYKDFL